MIVSEIAVTLFLFIVGIRFFTSPHDRKRSEILLVAAFFAFPAIRFFQILAGNLIRCLAAWRPVRYDLYAWSFDAHLGYSSFFLGRWVASSRFLSVLVAQVYDMPFLAMLAVFAVYVYLRESQKALPLWTFFFNAIVALPIYIAFPVAGPKFIFPNFPQGPGPVAVHRVFAAATVPNGVPSDHTSTALLCAALLWPWKWGRVFGVAFVLLTILATLANGEHYIFDLLTAVPYSWLIWKLAHWTFRPASSGQTTRVAAIEEPGATMQVEV